MSTMYAVALVYRGLMFRFFQPPRLEALISANTPPIVYPIGKSVDQVRSDAASLTSNAQKNDWDNSVVSL